MNNNYEHDFFEWFMAKKRDQIQLENSLNVSTKLPQQMRSSTLRVIITPWKAELV